jgi:hypothetical protein
MFPYDYISLTECIPGIVESVAVVVSVKSTTLLLQAQLNLTIT